MSANASVKLKIKRESFWSALQAIMSTATGNTQNGLESKQKGDYSI